jgi:hypothetical protein
MTSAESTLLGVVIGAALTWLLNVSNSRAQWLREDRRQQAERRMKLYQDMLAMTSKMVNEDVRHAVLADHAPAAE